MLRITISIFIVIFLFVLTVSLIKRKRAFPCPSWLTFLLENPFMESKAGSSVLIERIGLKEGMRVLDVGCGPGRLTIPFAEHVGINGEVVALDIQEKMLQKLMRRVKTNNIANVRFILGGVCQGKIQEENRFDRAVLVTVLGEIQDKESALEEIFKALKPGGILSVTEVFPDPDFQRQSKVLRLAATAGFALDGRYGNKFTFTMNFIKPNREMGQVSG
jgi:ubiquinone/menaquinone biosynthesis C-methylase UbiE